MGTTTMAAEAEGILCRALAEQQRTAAAAAPPPLSIDVAETTEERVQRLISENPLVVFSRYSCCMCHVIRRLLATLGVHPTVIELQDDEIREAGALLCGATTSSSAAVAAPVVFIGGAHVGGLEGLVALHLSGRLLPTLREVGATW